VKGSPNKADLVREALRVLKKGGSFPFQDLFGIERFYGKPADLLKSVRDWGVHQVA
jgi:hypothetical protein